jgi:hypothetical protein
MAGPARLKRKSFFVDEAVVRSARKALGASTDAETIRTSLERVAEMEAFWQFLKRSRRSLPPGSLREP